MKRCALCVCVSHEMVAACVFMHVTWNDHSFRGRVIKFMIGVFHRIDIYGCVVTPNSQFAAS